MGGLGCGDDDGSERSKRAVAGFSLIEGPDECFLTGDEMTEAKFRDEADIVRSVAGIVWGGDNEVGGLGGCCVWMGVEAEFDDEGVGGSEVGAGPRDFGCAGGERLGGESEIGHRGLGGAGGSVGWPYGVNVEAALGTTCEPLVAGEEALNGPRVVVEFIWVGGEGIPVRTLAVGEVVPVVANVCEVLSEGLLVGGISGYWAFELFCVCA